MTERESRWVVFLFARWDNFELNLPLQMAAKMPDGSVGFVPVFETREEAEKMAAGRYQVQEIRVGPLEAE